MESTGKKQDGPIITVALSDLVGWSLDRTSDLPKSQRFTFGQRLDGLSLEALQLSVRAYWVSRNQKQAILDELNITLEELRILWRLVHRRGWISQSQLVFVTGQIDEIGRMTGGWKRSLSAPVQNK